VVSTSAIDLAAGQRSRLKSDPPPGPRHGEAAAGRDQLEEHHVDLVGHRQRAVLGAVGHDEEFARADLTVTVPELHPKAPPA
jgi:hypothetical protein